MTTPERVAELLAEDERLTDETKQALAELFRVAYEQFADDDESDADNRRLTTDQDLTTMAGAL